MAEMISSGVAVSSGQGVPSSTSWVEPGKGSRYTAGTMRPLMLGARAILRTRPEAGACIETDMKPSKRAIRCPL